MFQVPGGLALGFIAGLAGVVVYSGPLDMPVVGLILAAAIVGAGAWFAWESGQLRVWVSYAVAVLATTMVFMYLPPSDDSLGAVDPVYSNIWMVLSALAAVIPAVLAMRADDRRRKYESLLSSES